MECYIIISRTYQITVFPIDNDQKTGSQISDKDHTPENNRNGP